MNEATAGPAAHPAKVGTAVPALRVRNLSKRFAGRVALRDVSFDVATNEMVGLVGPNGAGKTTVIQLISGAYRADSGSVQLDGREICRKRSHAISHLGLARTFQQTRPFARMSAAENVMVAALAHGHGVRAAREKALECLGFVGLSAQADKQAQALSTGQRKRLELARAVATDPKVLLLDEVTAGVDERTTDELVALIGTLRVSGMTIVFVEHDLSLLRGLCDRLIALHLGEKIAEGTPAEVLGHSMVIDSYVGSR
jgi:branched-chain amino acid transport system ATP-binding protein